MRCMPVCLAFILAVSAANADILPKPDRGPSMATVAGLDFAIQNVTVKYPPGYTKTLPTVVLTGCTDGHENCRLARSKNLIGMEVLSVDGAGLEPDPGRIQQIIAAFSHGKGTQRVTLELYSRSSAGAAIMVAFARK